MHCCQVELEFRNVFVCFVEGGKPEYPEKNPRCRDKNQQQINKLQVMTALSLVILRNAIQCS